MIVILLLEQSRKVLVDHVVLGMRWVVLSASSVLDLGAVLFSKQMTRPRI